MLCDTAPQKRVLECLDDIQKEKKRCMKQLKELYPNDIKQKGCFIDTVLRANRTEPKPYNPFDSDDDE
jgi:hypothetical protein